ncbi:MAG: hypothetical protein U1F52_20970 [Burkholderiales bacterium]
MATGGRRGAAGKGGGTAADRSEDVEGLLRDLDPEDREDAQSGDFRFGLEELLKTYRPLIEEELKRSDEAEALAKEAISVAPTCEDEYAAARQFIARFFTDEVAVRLLPLAARELLGNPERWRWCLAHIRCCVIFGWLLCRKPRTFRGSNYYLYRFWRCVREAVGFPLGTTLGERDRQDFARLVRALADAYKPYLTDQLASVDFPEGIPDEVLAGTLDCFSDEDATSGIFERLLSPDIAPALLGEAAFEKHRQDAFFWFCRCWCLCAIRFGCCLARARNLREAVRCLLFYRRCLRDCLQPLRCDLQQPTGCVAESVNTDLAALVVPVIGTASGGMFHHYVLEWSRDGVAWHADSFFYPPIPPGNAVQGNTAVNNGVLAYFDTSAMDPGFYFLRMTVTSTQGTTRVCRTEFSLFKQEVRILSVDGAALDTVWSDPGARFVENVPGICEDPPGTWKRAPGVEEMSFGDCLYLYGGAFVGGCDGQRIRRYMIDTKPGFETNCFSGGWSNVWKVEYNTIWQYRDMNLRKDTANLTSVWVSDCIVPVPFPPYCLHSEPQARLAPSCWQSHTALCVASGLFTLRLMVEDTDGNLYCDTQRVWIDNKPICAAIRIDAVPKCADVNVSAFADPPDCGTPWHLPLSGIAYDDYIDDTLPLTRPNDNFDYYVVTVTKQGGPTFTIPVSFGPSSACTQGTMRVGKCEPCNALDPRAGDVYGLLANFDLRAVDDVCQGSLPYPVPTGFALARGECCVYVFELTVYDRTARSSGVNWAQANWPVKICNDLKAP